jgi:hypothetical protein
MWGAFDRLLAILAPGVIIRWDICQLAANCWHLDCPFQSQFSVQEKKRNNTRFRACSARISTNFFCPLTSNEERNLSVQDFFFGCSQQK